MRTTILPLALLLASTLAAQTLQFEVASIRPTSPEAANNNRVNVGLHLDGSQARINALGLRDYIAMAYEVRPNQIEGAEWLDDRFDIHGTLPPGAKSKQIPEMLQGLLANRFGLKFHRVKKEFQVLVLSRGARPLALAPSADQSAATEDGVTIAAEGSGNGVSVDLGNGASYNFANGKFIGKKLDMETVADSLSLYMTLPVVDETNLKGFYDMTFEITPEDYRAMLLRAAMRNGVVLPPQAQQLADTSTTPSFFDALDKVGLKLESKRVPLDVLVIDQMSRTPTDN